VTYKPDTLYSLERKFMGFGSYSTGMYSKALCLSAVIKHNTAEQPLALAQTPMQFSTQLLQPIYFAKPRCELTCQLWMSRIRLFAHFTQSLPKKRHVATSVSDWLDVIIAL